MRPQWPRRRSITNVDPYQAQLINKMRRGSLLVPGQTLLIMEVEPAAYITLAANEAEKAADIQQVYVSNVGRFGRYFAAGSESEIEAARDCPRSRPSRARRGRRLMANSLLDREHRRCWPSSPACAGACGSMLWAEYPAHASPRVVERVCRLVFAASGSRAARGGCGCDARRGVGAGMVGASTAMRIGEARAGGAASRSSTSARASRRRWRSTSRRRWPSRLRHPRRAAPAGAPSAAPTWSCSPRACRARPGRAAPTCWRRTASIVVDVLPRDPPARARRRRDRRHEPARRDDRARPARARASRAARVIGMAGHARHGAASARRSPRRLDVPPSQRRGADARLARRHDGAGAAARDGQRPARSPSCCPRPRSTRWSSGRATAAPRSCGCCERGSAWWAPSAAIVEMVRAIVRDERRVLPVSRDVPRPVRHPQRLRRRAGAARRAAAWSRSSTRAWRRPRSRACGRPRSEVAARVADLDALLGEDAAAPAAPAAARSPRARPAGRGGVRDLRLRVAHPHRGPPRAGARGRAGTASTTSSPRRYAARGSVGEDLGEAGRAAAATGARGRDAARTWRAGSAAASQRPWADGTIRSASPCQIRSRR